MEKEMTTNEIFQESMKISNLVWEKTGINQEKLKEYQEWLNKKWMAVEFKDEIEISK